MMGLIGLVISCGIAQRNRSYCSKENDEHGQVGKLAKLKKVAGEVGGEKEKFVRP